MLDAPLNKMAAMGTVETAELPPPCKTARGERLDTARIVALLERTAEMVERAAVAPGAEFCSIVREPPR